MSHQWHYMKQTFLGDEQVGPVGEVEFTNIIKSGSIKTTTLVNSPTRTKGQWREAQQIPVVAKLIETSNAKRAAQKMKEKQAAKEERAKIKAEKNQAREEARLKQQNEKTAPAIPVAQPPVQAPPAPAPPTKTPQHAVPQHAPVASPSPERTVWIGRPSQICNWRYYIKSGLLFFLIVPVCYSILRWLNLPYYIKSGLLFLLIVPVCYSVFYSILQWLKIRTRRYELTNQRLKTSWGMVARQFEELELYRVKDITLTQSRFERFFGLGTIHLTTSDISDPCVVIWSINIKVARQLRENIRTLTESLRDKKSVREVDNR